VQIIKLSSDAPCRIIDIYELLRMNHQSAGRPPAKRITRPQYKELRAEPGNNNI
jgi:hypothetical protein